jgi:hypothetical protein
VNPQGEAEDLARGILHYFDHQAIQAGMPPGWHRNPFTGDSVYEMGGLIHGLPCGRLDSEPKPCGELHGPDEPQGIFFKCLWEDHAKQAFIQVCPASVRIKNRPLAMELAIALMVKSRLPRSSSNRQLGVKVHFEVNCPEPGNSGFYLRGRYEVQIEYEAVNENPPERQMGSIYGRITPKEMPRTMDAAIAEAQRLAGKSNAAARAFISSGFLNDGGR